MNTTRRSFLKQSTLTALIAAGVGPLSLLDMSCARSAEGVPTDTKRQKPQWKLPYKSPVDPVNQSPYISLYYVRPKVLLGSETTINYYLTDYDHSEYMYDDDSAEFSVDYWVNGKKHSVANLKAGDHSITLKALPKGKVLFALQATDNKGRKTHRLFQEFRVIEAADEAIPASKIYHADLAKFGISNDDTHPVETTAGLTAMLQWAHKNGYRKVLLPQGTYRLDEKKAVQMATNLTLDMNGATFKLNPSAEHKVIMLEMFQCTDSHIVNGTFEGDLKEHDFKKATHNSEWVNAIAFAQGAQYCSFENVKVVDVTGYGSNTTMISSTTNSYSAQRPLKARDFVAGDIDSSGKLVASPVRSSSAQMIDISSFQKSYGFIQLGRYLGYQGISTPTWIYKASFYDANKKFIETIEGYYYRRLYLPKNAHFVRFTCLDKTAGTRLAVFNFRAPYNCVFKNVHHQNVRCVGMVPSGFNNLLVEKCSFENCGWAAAKCAFDAEDGWDCEQDLTFRNNTFGKNPHTEFMCVSGHNFVVENNSMQAYLRNRYFVVRNNQLKSAGFEFGTRRNSGAPRVYKNTIAGQTRLITKAIIKGPHREFCIRDNVCQGGAIDYTKRGSVAVAYYYKCQINGGNINAKAVKCQLKNIKNGGYSPDFAIFESTIDSSHLRVSGNNDTITVIDSKATKTQFLPARGSVVLLQDNTLNDCECLGDLAGQVWKLRGNTITTALPHLFALKKYCHLITLQNNTITSTNPQFACIDRQGLIRDEKQVIKIDNNTFQSKGGVVIQGSAPSGNRQLEITFTNNTGKGGINDMNSELANSSNVKLIEKNNK